MQHIGIYILFIAALSHSLFTNAQLGPVSTADKALMKKIFTPILGSNFRVNMEEFAFLEYRDYKFFMATIRNICRDRMSIPCLVSSSLNIDGESWTRDGIKDESTKYFQNRGGLASALLPGRLKHARSVNNTYRLLASGQVPHKYIETRPKWRKDGINSNSVRAIDKLYRVVYDIGTEDIYFTMDHYNRFVPFSVAKKGLVDISTYTKYAAFVVNKAEIAKSNRQQLQDMKLAYETSIVNSFYQLGNMFKKLRARIGSDTDPCTPADNPFVLPIEKKQFLARYKQFLGCAAPVSVFAGGKLLTDSQVLKYLQMFQLEAFLSSDAVAGFSLSITDNKIIFNGIKVGVTEHIVSGAIQGPMYGLSGAPVSNAIFDGVFLTIWSEENIESKDSFTADIIAVLYFGTDQNALDYKWYFYPVYQNPESNPNPREWLVQSIDSSDFPQMSTVFSKLKTRYISYWKDALVKQTKQKLQMSLVDAI